MSTRQINKLKHADQFKLMKLVEAEFIERRQTDDEFAAYAAEKLGFKINGNNVFSARHALGIESSRIKMTTSTIESRLLLVEKRLAILEDVVNRLQS